MCVRDIRICDIYLCTLCTLYYLCMHPCVHLVIANVSIMNIHISR